MKSKHYKLFSAVAKFVVSTGVYIGIKPACSTVTYQPKIPKHLIEKK